MPTRCDHVTSMHVQLTAVYHSPHFQTCFLFFANFPQGILASTLSFQLTCANYHRLGMVARAGESGSRARNASAANCHHAILCL